MKVVCYLDEGRISSLAADQRGISVSVKIVMQGGYLNITKHVYFGRQHACPHIMPLFYALYFS